MERFYYQKKKRTLVELRTKTNCMYICDMILVGSLQLFFYLRRMNVKIKKILKSLFTTMNSILSLKLEEEQ